MEREERGDWAIEYAIEDQRSHLDSSKLTPVNQETFAAWHMRWKKKREEDRKKREAAEKKKVKRATGRAVFSINPNLFVDNDGAADDGELEQEKDEEEEKMEIKEIADTEEEEWLWQQIEEAQNMPIEEGLFNEEVGDVDLDDLDLDG